MNARWLIQMILETVVALIVLAVMVSISVVVHEYFLDKYMERRGYVSKERLMFDYPRHKSEIEMPWYYSHREAYNKGLDDVREYIQGVR